MSDSSVTEQELTWKERKQITDEFYAWFSEEEKYGFREERFWGAVDRQDEEELLQWLKIAWRLGYESGKRSN